MSIMYREKVTKCQSDKVPADFNVLSKAGSNYFFVFTFILLSSTCKIFSFQLVLLCLTSECERNKMLPRFQLSHGVEDCGNPRFSGLMSYRGVTF
jgi:hypothetical protein